MKHRPSIVETLPDWAHGLLAVFIAGTSALLGTVLM